MKRKIAVLMAVGTLAIGGAALVFAFSLSQSKETEPVKVAATNTNTSTIFFDTWGYKSDSRWSDPDCYLRYWNGSSSQYVKMTKINNQYWYGSFAGIDIQAYNSGFCIRNSGSGSDDSNETSWIGWNSWSSQSFNCLQLKGDEEGSRCGVNWLTLNEVPTSFGGDGSTVYMDAGAIAPSYESQRIWCRSSSSSWYDNGAATAIRAWSDSGTTIYRTYSIQNSVNSLFYWYADIPLNVNGFQFVRICKDMSAVYDYSDNASLSTGYLINYIYLDGTYKVSAAPIDDGKVTANIAAKVLEGYTTCCDSSVNGYGAVSSLSTNWFNTTKMGESEYSAFGTTSISDYSYDAYHSNGDAYFSDQSKSATVTCAEKWAKMQSEFAEHSSMNILGGSDSSLDNISTIGAIGLLALLGFGGFVVYRKRKTD